MAQPLRRDARGNLYVHLGDDVFEAESEEELAEEYDYVRKAENVGWVRLQPKRYAFGTPVLVE